MIHLAKSISIRQGTGSIRHNNRTFHNENVDPSRTRLNIVIVQEPLEEAYHKCFDGAVERYNEVQRKKHRLTRQIDDYYKHVFGRDYTDTAVFSTVANNSKKSFYEVIFQIGCKEDTGVNTPDAELAKECLIEFVETFQEQNPNFYVFNAVIHMDESTPHLHINYIPIGHCKRGLDTQNAMSQALEEMGYKRGPEAIIQWHEDQRERLTAICKSKGIEIKPPAPSRGYSYTVDEYKRFRADTDKLIDEVRQFVTGVKNDANASLADRLQARSFEKALDTIDWGPLAGASDTQEDKQDRTFFKSGGTLRRR